MVGSRNALGGALLLLVVGCVAAGCAAGQEGSGSTTASGGDGGSGDGGAGAGLPTTSSGDGGDGPGVTVTGGTSSTSTGGEEQIAEVYGHSATTLYRLDPETKQVSIVSPFSGCDDDVVDIALDKDSNLYGTTLNRGGDPVPNGGLWRIDKNTAACTLVARGDFPNSLSFVPAGTLDPDEEALVGYVNANYVRIDTVGGQITTIRANALTGGLVSSGDIVSVIDGPTLLTVKGGTSCDDLDCVIEVDPATGTAVGNLGSAGYNNVFGVAFWAGSLYGFTSEGDLFEFVKDESGGITTTPIPVGSGLEFYGAGSTTAAPPTEVPN